MVLYEWIKNIDEYEHLESYRTYFSDLGRHIPNGLKFVKYHGSGRAQMNDHLRTANVVLTTYATVAAELDKRSSPIYEIKWYRIVLDEGMLYGLWFSSR